MWHQTSLVLRPRPRGFHLITDEITTALPIRTLQTGLLHVFLQHTSASLTINENASPDVRRDFETFTSHLIPDGWQHFEHTLEGDDDMPAHIKASFFGPSLTIPVQGGRLALGRWQGIYLCEHRHHGGARSLVLTLHGAD